MSIIISNYTRKRIVKLLNKGADRYYISNMLGISVSTVYMTGKKAGINFKKDTSERDKTIIRMYREGTTVAKISRELKIAPTTIQQVFDRNGIIRRVKEPSSKRVFDVLKKLIDGNKTFQQIGIEVGLTYQAISVIYISAKEAGLPVHKRETHAVQ